MSSGEAHVWSLDLPAIADLVHCSEAELVHAMSSRGAPVYAALEQPQPGPSAVGSPAGADEEEGLDALLPLRAFTAAAEQQPAALMIGLGVMASDSMNHLSIGALEEADFAVATAAASRAAAGDGIPSSDSFDQQSSCAPESPRASFIRGVLIDAGGPRAGASTPSMISPLYSRSPHEENDAPRPAPAESYAMALEVPSAVATAMAASAAARFGCGESDAGSGPGGPGGHAESLAILRPEAFLIQMPSAELAAMATRTHYVAMFDPSRAGVVGGEAEGLTAQAVHEQDALAAAEMGVAEGGLSQELVFADPGELASFWQLFKGMRLGQLPELPSGIKEITISARIGAPPAVPSVGPAAAAIVVSEATAVPARRFALALPEPPSGDEGVPTAAPAPGSAPAGVGKWTAQQMPKRKGRGGANRRPRLTRARAFEVKTAQLDASQSELQSDCSSQHPQLYTGPVLATELFVQGV
ncbi:hypothetical protein T492DRAFT_928161 [Pavlovales sp. CCMP2436]|nr:hypothetical protein T492DRAFT_928161 [Pavlovales sp. CCMP2436]